MGYDLPADRVAFGLGVDWRPVSNGSTPLIPLRRPEAARLPTEPMVLRSDPYGLIRVGAGSGRCDAERRLRAHNAG